MQKDRPRRNRLQVEIQCETWIHQTSRGERNRRKAGKLKHQLELRGGSLIGLARTRELAQQRIDSWRDQGQKIDTACAGVDRIDVLRDRSRVIDTGLDAEQQINLGALRREIGFEGQAGERAAGRAAVADGRDTVRDRRERPEVTPGLQHKGAGAVERIGASDKIVAGNDAGDVAWAVVLNSFNIAATGTVTGLAAAPVPNVALTTTTPTSPTERSGQPQQTSPNEQPSIIIVEVVGYGGTGGDSAAPSGGTTPGSSDDDRRRRGQGQ